MPSHVRPLADHPQLDILRTALSGSQDQEDEVVEYRVYNFQRWRDGTVARGDRAVWLDLLAVGVLALVYKRYELEEALRRGLSESQWSTPLAVWFALLVVYIWAKTRTILHQSVIALPKLGVQLETTRGISLRLPFLHSLYSRPSFGLTTAATFIPLEHISTIVVNEGLRLWKVEHYLAIVHKGGRDISVGFDAVRPPGAVLREVLHGLRETLFAEYASEASSE